MIRITIVCFSLWLSATVVVAAATAKAAKNPYSLIQYDSVVIYDMEKPPPETESVIDKSGTLVSGITKRATLSAHTAKKLSILLGQRSSFGKQTAACFEPHLGVVYYYKGKVEASITICVDCNRLESSRDLPAQKQKREGSKEEGYYYMGDGMSKRFRKFLNSLLKANNFSHQIPYDSAFD